MFNEKAREKRIEIFEDTMKLCKNKKRLSEAVGKSIAGTKIYAVEGSIDVTRNGSAATKISVTDERTFRAAKRLCDEYAGRFDNITFAVYCLPDDKGNYNTFSRMIK